MILGVSRGRFMSFRLLIVRLMLVVCFALFLLFFFRFWLPCLRLLNPHVSSFLIVAFGYHAFRWRVTLANVIL